MKAEVYTVNKAIQVCMYTYSLHIVMSRVIIDHRHQYSIAQ